MESNCCTCSLKEIIHNDYVKIFTSYIYEDNMCFIGSQAVLSVRDGKWRVPENRNSQPRQIYICDEVQTIGLENHPSIHTYRQVMCTGPQLLFVKLYG